MLKSHYNDIRPFITKDGSIIRELLHPAHHGVRLQSFAEAIVPPGVTTLLHRHQQAEEIYHITAGSGLMRLGEEQFPVAAGDTLCIPPGTPHNIRNTGDGDLIILCSCSPAYADHDTEIIE